MPRINITTNDGLLVSSIEAPPSYALERDWRFHAVARNMPGWLVHFVRNAEMLERGATPVRPEVEGGDLDARE